MITDIRFALQVNHSDPEHHFVSADGVHTQRIESSWRPFKYRMRHKYGRDEAAMATFLCEYMWRHWIKESGQSGRSYLFWKSSLSCILEFDSHLSDLLMTVVGLIVAVIFPYDEALSNSNPTS